MKRLIALSTIIICLLLVSLWTVHALRHDILVLQTGQSLSVQSSWVVRDRVFYLVDDELDVIELEKVQRIVDVKGSDPQTWPRAVAAHFRHSLQEAGFSQWRDRLLGKTPLLMVLLGLATAGWIAFVRYRKRRKGRVPEQGQDDALARGFAPRLAGFSDVESLFADLFRFQVGAPETMSCKVQPVTDAGTGSGRTYNLSIVHEETTRSRRMTIAPIGENTGSKSQCFSVIYDHPIVVKVPPTPITLLSEYYDDLRSEFAVRKKLSPRECVIPGLSVICKKLHKFPDIDPENEEGLELQYMQWLERHPEYQRFLQIGGGFAFFMDLTRYFFLSQVVAPFHDLGIPLRKELVAAADAIGSLDLFEDRYGPKGAELFAALQGTWEDFRATVEGPSTGTEALEDRPSQRMREWFVFAMAGRRPEWEALQEPDDAPDALASQLEAAVSAHRKTSQSFRSMVEGVVSTRLFERHAPMMGEMGTNLLDLLAWLYEKRVAIRDLKPDNLLVAGNRTEYPQFLASASRYAIGLIDLETAVDFGTPDTTGIAQPQLGGTPLYGTPSHLFPNQVLRRAHDDLPPVLHMQDWYAVVAIFFEIVTGDVLFGKPARQFPAILRRLSEAMAAGADLLTVYHETAAGFWPLARQTFLDALHQGRDKLDRVFVRVPDAIHSRLVEHADARSRECRMQVDRYLDDHELFRRGANRERLQQYTVVEVEQLRKKYAKSPRRKELEPLLKGLIRVKREEARASALVNVLAADSNRIRSTDLLFAMFEAVCGVMQPARDTSSPPALPPQEQEGSPEGLRYTVTVGPGFFTGKQTDS